MVGSESEVREGVDAFGIREAFGIRGCWEHVDLLERDRRVEGEDVLAAYANVREERRLPHT